MSINANLIEQNVSQIIGEIMIIVDVSVKKFVYVKMIICDEVMKSYNEEIEIKTNPRDFNENKGTCKTQSCYILFAFVLITITVILIALSIYWYLKKYPAKQKHLLPFDETKLIEFYLGGIN